MTVSTGRSWRHDVSRYQWLVLVIASAGWVFDAFEGQIFNISRDQMLAELLGVASGDPAVRYWGDVFLGIFLIGGTFGGLLFGWLGDRWGRRPAMILSILFYSVFSGLTYFVTDIRQVGVLRFLVAMGVGGEWAVAAALVAEVVPARARAHMSGIFHSTSILGAFLAAWAGLAVGANWRVAFLIGIVPALLVLWVRSQVAEPETWLAAKRRSEAGTGAALGSFRDLLGNPLWSRRAWLGLLLAAIGLGTFWGVSVAGQDIARDFLLRQGVDPALATERAKFAYGNIEAIAAGIGMLAFGPLAVRFGRKRTFALYFVASTVIVPITCYAAPSYEWQLALLAVFGFFTWGLHAGFAIYFPELFPHHLRSTGAGFCFNGGRLLASAVLIFSGWLKALPGMDLRLVIVMMAGLFPVGLLVIHFLPETRGQELPDG
jgi:MFS family permease